MWLADFPSLVLIIAAGLQLGILGFFGYDITTAVLGGDAKYAFILAGVAAVWQLFRQRFF